MTTENDIDIVEQQNKKDNDNSINTTNNNVATEMEIQVVDKEGDFYIDNNNDEDKVIGTTSVLNNQSMSSHSTSDSHDKRHSSSSSISNNNNDSSTKCCNRKSSSSHQSDSDIEFFPSVLQLRRNLSEVFNNNQNPNHHYNNTNTNTYPIHTTTTTTTTNSSSSSTTTTNSTGHGVPVVVVHGGVDNTTAIEQQQPLLQLGDDGGCEEEGESGNTIGISLSSSNLVSSSSSSTTNSSSNRMDDNKSCTDFAKKIQLFERKHDTNTTSLSKNKITTTTTCTNTSSRQNQKNTHPMIHTSNSFPSTLPPPPPLLPPPAAAVIASFPITTKKKTLSSPNHTKMIQSDNTKKHNGSSTGPGGLTVFLRTRPLLMDHHPKKNSQNTSTGASASAPATNTSTIEILKSSNSILKPTTILRTIAPESSNAYKFARNNSGSNNSTNNNNNNNASFQNGHGIVKEYEFQQIFDDKTSQRFVYQHTVQPMINGLFGLNNNNKNTNATNINTNGQSALIFCYGITNSGKTYTVTGPEKELSIVSSLSSKQQQQQQQKKEEQQPSQSQSQSQKDGVIKFQVPASWGLVPRALYDILNQIQVLNHHHHHPSTNNSSSSSSSSRLASNQQYQLYISYFEIYNEQIIDLLPNSDSNGSNNSNHNSSKNAVTSFSKLQRVHVTNLMEGIKIITMGQQNRASGTNQVNSESSRSHAICQFHVVIVTVQVTVVAGTANQVTLKNTKKNHPLGEITCGEKNNNAYQHGNANIKNHNNGGGSMMNTTTTVDPVELGTGTALWIVDLAGSERSKRTNGTRLQETVDINKSLMTLNRCFTALREKNQIKTSTTGASSTGTTNTSSTGQQNNNNSSSGNNNNVVIPYRDSKLTQLFGQHFTGQHSNRTIMIVNIHPSVTDFDETQHVLMYATAAKTIQFVVPSNNNPTNGNNNHNATSEYGMNGRRKVIGGSASNNNSNSNTTTGFMIGLPPTTATTNSRSGVNGIVSRINHSSIHTIKTNNNYQNSRKRKPVVVGAIESSQQKHNESVITNHISVIDNAAKRFRFGVGNVTSSSTTEATKTTTAVGNYLKNSTKVHEPCVSYNDDDEEEVVQGKTSHNEMDDDVEAKEEGSGPEVAPTTTTMIPSEVQVYKKEIVTLKMKLSVAYADNVILKKEVDELKEQLSQIEFHVRQEVSEQVAILTKGYEEMMDYMKKQHIQQLQQYHQQANSQRTSSSSSSSNCHDKIIESPDQTSLSTSSGIASGDSENIIHLQELRIKELQEQVQECEDEMKRINELHQIELIQMINEQNVTAASASTSTTFQNQLIQSDENNEINNEFGQQNNNMIQQQDVLCIDVVEDDKTNGMILNQEPMELNETQIQSQLSQDEDFRSQEQSLNKNKQNIDMYDITMEQQEPDCIVLQHHHHHELEQVVTSNDETFVDVSKSTIVREEIDADDCNVVVVEEKASNDTEQDSNIAKENNDALNDCQESFRNENNDEFVVKMDLRAEIIAIQKDLYNTIPIEENVDSQETTGIKTEPLVDRECTIINNEKKPKLRKRVAKSKKLMAVKRITRHSVKDNPDNVIQVHVSDENENKNIHLNDIQLENLNHEKLHVPIIINVNDDDDGENNKNNDRTSHNDKLKRTTRSSRQALASIINMSK